MIDPETRLPASDTNGSHPDNVLLALFASWMRAGSPSTERTPMQKLTIHEAAEANHRRVTEDVARAAELDAARKARLAGTRPALTAAGAVPYLDWLTSNLHDLPPTHIVHHMQAAELAIRTLAVEAQDKATQHTLVQDGIIDPPPNAS